MSKRQGEDQAAGTGGAGGSAGASSGDGGKAPSAAGATASNGGASSNGGAPGNAGTLGNAGAPMSEAGAPALADNPFPCESPTPTVDRSTGFVECANGYSYRESVGTCPLLRRPEPVPGGPPDPECRYDADCDDDPQGYCWTGYCQHSCLVDSECNNGYICACGSSYGIGTCISAECTSDADCTPGLHCALIVDGTSDSAIYTFACQTEADTCVTDADCPLVGATGSGNCELGDAGRYCLVLK